MVRGSEHAFKRHRSSRVMVLWIDFAIPGGRQIIGP